MISIVLVRLDRTAKEHFAVRLFIRLFISSTIIHLAVRLLKRFISEGAFYHSKLNNVSKFKYLKVSELWQLQF